MVKDLKIKKRFKNLVGTINLCLLLFLSPFYIFGQKKIVDKIKKTPISKENFQYLNYSNFTFHFNRVLYMPAYHKKLVGVYDIEPKTMSGFNFGIHYNIHYFKNFNLYTGLDIEFLPFYNLNLNIPNKESPSGFPFISFPFKKINFHNILSIPFGLGYCSKWETKNDNLFYTINTDIRFHLVQQGGAEMERATNSISYFFIYGDTQPINILSPTFNLSGGLDWFTKMGILKLNIQKGIVPFLQGEYKIFNLKESPDTKGIYKVRMDYVGIDLGFTPIRRKKNRYY